MPTPLNGSVIKAFEVLSLFSSTQPEISSAIVSERLGLNNSTAHRFLMTLEAVGALRGTKRGYFALGPKLDELKKVVDDTNPLAQFVQPHIDDLSRQLGESVMVCRLARHGPTCVAVANSSHPISVNINVGTLLPMVATAQGKLWLSEMSPADRRARLSAQNVVGTSSPEIDDEQLDCALDEIKRNGYASNLGDNEPDIAAISVPVRDSTKRMVLSLSVFGMLSRFDDAFQTNALSRLTQTSHAITGAIA